MPLHRAAGAAGDSKAVGVSQLRCRGRPGKDFPSKTGKLYTEPPKRMGKKGRREKISGVSHSDVN